MILYPFLQTLWTTPMHYQTGREKETGVGGLPGAAASAALPRATVSLPLRGAGGPLAQGGALHLSEQRSQTGQNG